MSQDRSIPNGVGHGGIRRVTKGLRDLPVLEGSWLSPGEPAVLDVAHFAWLGVTDFAGFPVPGNYARHGFLVTDRAEDLAWAVVVVHPAEGAPFRAHVVARSREGVYAFESDGTPPAAEEYVVSFGPRPPAPPPEAFVALTTATIACECGGDAAGTTHSSWCPKGKK